MMVVRTAADLRAHLEGPRRDGRSIGFVATMGALHEGHLSLVDAARARTDVVVLSIFVNPLQFGPHEDFAAYPRDEDRDLGVARERGVDVVLLPETSEMYPDGRITSIPVGPLGDVLEGEDRPGHFDGVATVVVTLLNIVAPDVAFFGQKDAQQVAVVKRVVRDLALPVEIEVGPTVRAPDGLALSSRNAYLGDDERRRAGALRRALEAGKATVLDGDLGAAEKAMWEVLISTDGVDPRYAKIVDPDSFERPETWDRSSPLLLVVAARVGGTRLIDNLLVE